MDQPFIYEKYVTGKQFLNRKNSTTILSNLLSHGENVAIYSPPKSGKMSLVQQTLFEMRTSSKQFVTATVDLLGIRSVKDFLLAFGDRVIRAFATTPQEYSTIIRNYLAGSHFVFDQRAYSERDEIVSLNWDLDDEDTLSMLRLPYYLAADKDIPLYILLTEFQNIEFSEGSYQLLKIFENVIKESREQLQKPLCAFIMMGSKVNAMKDIFEHRKLFWKLVERFTPGQIEEKDVIEHVVKGLLASGKVVDKELIISIYKLFRGDIWYINHFVSICDHLSKGYIMEPVLLEALDRIISIHEPRFQATVNDLTTFQLSLLKAIIDGNNKFSSAELISRYGLNSPANVKRLKDALMKKEIVTFDDRDEPVIMDPLFEFWLKKYFFHKKTDF